MRSVILRVVHHRAEGVEGLGTYFKCGQHGDAARLTSGVFIEIAVR